MTAIVVVRSGHEHGNSSDAARALQSLADQGFAGRRELHWEGGRAYWFTSDLGAHEAALLVEIEDGFVACVGYVAYAGQHGEHALSRLWHDFHGPQILYDDKLYGGFVILIKKNNQVWLFGDQIGLVKVFQTTDGHVISTSWLACVQACRRPGLHRLGACDYVLNGANHGLLTPVAQVELFDPTTAVELVGGQIVATSGPDTWQAGNVHRSIDAAADVGAQLLRNRLGRIAGAYPGGVRSALSAGFDSRLILSALQAANSPVHSFVYGSPDDEDVQVALQVGLKCGFEVEHLDKSVINRDRAPVTKELVQANALFFDGTPTDSLFDRGGDRQTRLTHAQSGALQLNGGGGEILRNFFYLRDRPYSVTDLVQTFYHPFVKRVFRRDGDYHDYMAMMVASLGREVGSGGQLDRKTVELAYPIYRVRYWTSRNNSLAARHGAFHTPLVDPPLVRLAAALPMAWKNYGKYESRLIGNLSAQLADVNLGYGFSPASGPSGKYMAGMFVQNMRPPKLRAASGAIKRAIGLAKPPQIEPAVSALFPDLNVLQDTIDPAGLLSSEQLKRMYSLQALAEQFGITSTAD